MYDMGIVATIIVAIEQMTTADDMQVINRIRKGDVNAFEVVVENYQTAIGRFIYRMTGDYHLTQDLTQDAFVRAYKSILKTHSEISLKAWLYRIARNVVFAHNRRKRLISFVPFSKTGEEALLDPEDLSQQGEERLTIQNTLCQVSYDKRVCMVLHYVEGYKYREISELLGISEDAVRKRVARGNVEFRCLYEKEGGGRK